MLIDDHRSSGGSSPCLVTWPFSLRLRWWLVEHSGAAIRIALGVLGVLALLVGAQLWAAHEGLVGPLTSLRNDYVGTPESATMPWAGLGIALVGLSARRRLLAVAAAAGIDLLFLLGRSMDGASLTVGNGPTIVITALAAVAVLRWRGRERRTALHALALGVLLVMASKIADTWLAVSAITRPRVLDQYLQLSDRALGNPSWLMGRALQAAGPTVSGSLHWVYAELAAAAMVVAVWQLRDVTTSTWPRHYLLRTFLAVGLVGPIAYLVFPVVGPVFAYAAAGHGLQVGDYWPAVVPHTLAPKAFGFDRSTPRNCMPSMHAAWALTIFIHSRAAPRPLRWAGTLWLVCTVAATLGFGYHYGSDLVAGAVLCLTVESALREPDRGWDRYRTRLVTTGAAAFVGLLSCYRYLPMRMAEYPVIAGALVLGVLATVSTGFYATWFAKPDTVLARWGGRRAAAVRGQRSQSRIVHQSEAA
jgi:hypothetical protein